MTSCCLGLVRVALLVGCFLLITANAQSFVSEAADDNDLPIQRDVRNKVFARQALLEAYDEFGIDEHACQNEFEILGMYML